MAIVPALKSNLPLIYSSFGPLLFDNADDCYCCGAEGCGCFGPGCTLHIEFTLEAACGGYLNGTILADWSVSRSCFYLLDEGDGCPGSSGWYYSNFCQVCGSPESAASLNFYIAECCEGASNAIIFVPTATNGKTNEDLCNGDHAIWDDPGIPGQQVEWWITCL